MDTFLNKNDKQVYFNQIKGTVHEIQEDDKYCNLTLKVGHENSRFVSFAIKKIHFEQYTNIANVSDKVNIRFYLSSRKKNDRWYTTANILDIQKEN